jgi:ferredoxin
MATIDPYFADELKKYGAKDFDACFNCGNCTAVCTLSENPSNFPRMMVRLGMLGLKKEILESREPWLCYACGDCSETCPRQAEPAEYMAALRRYSIASTEPTGLTRLMFRNNGLFILITLVLAALLVFFLLALRPEFLVSRWIFAYLPYDVIHNMGLAIFGIAGLSMVWGTVSQSLRFGRQQGDPATRIPAAKALSRVAGELVNMTRHQECDLEEDSYWKARPFLVQPWFVHWTVMWGFIGLLVATALDFIWKDPATTTWWPSRILGTVAGLSLVYGTSLSIRHHLKKVTRSYSRQSPADVNFLWSLWIAGLTGFWLEIAVFFSTGNLLNQIVFLLHTLISMELVLLFAFSKFAHALYRPLALFFHYRNGGQ